MQRMTFGSINYNPPSRFLAELPSEAIEAAEGFATGKATPSGGSSSAGSRNSGNWRGGGGRQGSEPSGRTFGGSGSSGGSRPSPTSPLHLESKAPTRVVESYSKGDRVQHKVFGMGTVLSATADSAEVRFDKDGAVKKLMPAFAPMTKVK